MGRDAGATRAPEVRPMSFSPRYLILPAVALAVIVALSQTQAATRGTDRAAGCTACAPAASLLR